MGRTSVGESDGVPPGADRSAEGGAPADAEAPLRLGEAAETGAVLLTSCLKRGRSFSVPLLIAVRKSASDVVRLAAAAAPSSARSSPFSPNRTARCGRTMGKGRK